VVYALFHVFLCAQLAMYSSDSEDQSGIILMVFPLLLYLEHSVEHEGVGARKAAKATALRNFCPSTVCSQDNPHFDAGLQDKNRSQMV
jgi:hypothetical protein